MKAILALLSLLGAASAAPAVFSDSKSTALNARAANASFAKADGTRFNIDGKTQYYAGSNGYWLAFQMNNKDIDTVLDHFVASGLKIMRIWGFNDVSNTPGSNSVYFQSFSGSTPQINTGANGLQRLDYVVQAAEKRGVKLIINFVNNWTDYGGMAVYMKWATGSADSSTNRVFYTNTKIQTQYQAYIKAIVSRYVNSPAIFAWELANEPRCANCDTSVLTNWVTKTSAYIKSLDPNHMVTLGDEGFGLAGDSSFPYQTGEGIDWAKILAIPSIDFGTYHLYPGSWGTAGSDLGQSWGQKWITNHATVCKAANKPCLFEEYGIGSGDKCKVEGAWQTSALTNGAAGGDLFWDWGDQISSGKTSDDGNTVFYNSAQWTCLVKDHVAAASKS